MMVKGPRRVWVYERLTREQLKPEITVPAGNHFKVLRPQFSASFCYEAEGPGSDSTFHFLRSYLLDLLPLEVPLCFSSLLLNSVS